MSKRIRKTGLDTELLLELLSQPTAPFREARVIEFIIQVLKLNKIPYFEDKVGNIVIGASSSIAYSKALRKPRRAGAPHNIFCAHMDHPGFHGVKWESPLLLSAKWLGGSPIQDINGASCWIAHQSGWTGTARVQSHTLVKSGRALDQLVLSVSDQIPAPLLKSPKNFYGGFSFRAPVWHEGSLIFSKACDDLIGCFVILSLALKYNKKQLPFFGLLTRAEEVGFIGAIGHFEQGYIPSNGKKLQNILIVSLETSRTLLGAEIGAGPVVRLGDRSGVFSAAPLKVLTDVASRLLPGKHQKRVMDGGTCEATAAMAYGIPSIGISVPLGNYHNQNFQGGPDARALDGPAPEYVHQSDLEGMIKLCAGLAQKEINWKNPFEKRRNEFSSALKKSLISNNSN